MTRPRSTLISLESTPYYHCIARCVRRAFLCGRDDYTGKSFEHRKPWLTERLALLGEVFAIDIAAYAVMSNHYHVVLHVDSARQRSWSNSEVIERWKKIFKGPKLIHRFQTEQSLSDAELTLVTTLIKRWRERLGNISWFMRCLNEYLARRANAEDGCKGRFWEARFKSQALLDETALLSCMTYVDLNPVRAGIAKDLEHSNFTSVQDRILNIRATTTENSTRKWKTSVKPSLMPFAGTLRRDQRCSVIPFNLKDYLELVDWTGRIVRQEKKGVIGGSVPLLLDTLRLTSEEWTLLSLKVQKQAITMLHGLDHIRAMMKRSTKRSA